MRNYEEKNTYEYISIRYWQTCPTVMTPLIERDINPCAPGSLRWLDFKPRAPQFLNIKKSLGSMVFKSTPIGHFFTLFQVELTVFSWELYNQSYRPPKIVRFLFNPLRSFLLVWLERPFLTDFFIYNWIRIIMHWTRPGAVCLRPTLKIRSR